MTAKATSAFKRLKPRHRKFVKEYMADFNGSAAYVRAGYSPNGADAGAARLLTNPNVKAGIRECLEAEGITVGRIKCELAGIAFGDEPSKIVTGPSERREQDRLTALRELARVEGMVTEKREVTQRQKVNVVFDETDPAERAAHAKLARWSASSCGSRSSTLGVLIGASSLGRTGRPDI